MDQQTWGTGIICLGMALVLSGVLIYFTGFKWISWFGQLPGDISIKGETARVFIPITSMILLSLAVAIILRLIRIIVN